jgi:hypothetical protein
LNLLAGLWLVLAPYVLGYDVAVLALIDARRFRRSAVADERASA